eukprot:gene34740-44927_t
MGAMAYRMVVPACLPACLPSQCLCENRIDGMAAVAAGREADAARRTMVAASLHADHPKLTLTIGACSMPAAGNNLLTTIPAFPRCQPSSHHPSILPYRQPAPHPVKDSSLLPRRKPSVQTNDFCLNSVHSHGKIDRVDRGSEGSEMEGKQGLPASIQGQANCLSSASSSVVGILDSHDMSAVRLSPAPLSDSSATTPGTTAPLVDSNGQVGHLAVRSDTFLRTHPHTPIWRRVLRAERAGEFMLTHLHVGPHQKSGTAPTN